MKSGHDRSSSGTYSYICVGGDLLSNPTAWSSGGGFYSGPFHEWNLTDTSFIYSSIDIEINFESYICRVDSPPCVFDQIEWSSAAEEVRIVNSVPIPTSVWLFGSGLLGLIGIARNKAA